MTHTPGNQPVTRDQLEAAAAAIYYTVGDYGVPWVDLLAYERSLYTRQALAALYAAGLTVESSR